MSQLDYSRHYPADRTRCHGTVAVAPAEETHTGVAGLTPQGQLRSLHCEADEATQAERPNDCSAPWRKPGQPVTRGEAESRNTGSPIHRRVRVSADTMDTTTSDADAPKTADSTIPDADTPEPKTAANRVFVIGRDGEPLAPCQRKRAWKLIKAHRVKSRWYLADDLLAIQLKDRDLTNAEPAALQVRCNTGVRATGLAVVMTTPTEDRVVFQMEVAHRSDISRRLTERRTHRRRRRGEKWYRAPRFDNRVRAEDWTPPSIASVVSNQAHTIRRLAGFTSPSSVVVESGKFDTRKILEPDVEGVEYQQGPLYQSHIRAYVAQQWAHRCAYCGTKDWESARSFNLDHIVPRSAGGPTNIRNLVWSCQKCNQQKGSRNIQEFLSSRPEVLERIQSRSDKARPLAATGMYAQVCQLLVRRLREAGLTVVETTGADTAANRKAYEVPKSHANDAACCGANRRVTRLRTPLKVKAVGHGRRKQAKALPKAKYTAWQQLPPAKRRRTACPGHAIHPNNVNGIRTGDLAAILRNGVWTTGRAQVEAGTHRVAINTTSGRISTSKAAATRRLATRNGYRKSN